MGFQVRTAGKETFASASVGLKYFYSPWLSFSATIPYLFNDGFIEGTVTSGSRDFNVKGIGDLSLSATYDILERLNPSLEPMECPDTGDIYYNSLDKDKRVKNPHLSLSLGLSVPTGQDDFKDFTWIASPSYQPGTGVWRPSLGAYYSQGIGEIIPGAGISYTFSGGENSRGYRLPDSLSLKLGLNWPYARKKKTTDFGGSVYSALNANFPLDTARMNGEDIEGTDAESITLDIGTSFSITPDTTGGLLLTFPIIEGNSETGGTTGVNINIFLVYSY